MDFCDFKVIVFKIILEYIQRSSLLDTEIKVVSNESECRVSVFLIPQDPSLHKEVDFFSYDIEELEEDELKTWETDKLNKLL